MSYEDGQIKSINSNSLKLTYEYASDRVIISSSGTPVYRIDIADKLATRITDLKDQSAQQMTYDGNRNLVKIEAYFSENLTDTKILTYSNGDLASLTQTYPEDPAVKRVTTYNYATEVATKVDTDARSLIFGSLDLYIPSFLTDPFPKIF